MNDLIPVIIQDYTTLKVLMLGYMNNEALEKTKREKLVTFYSRSRQRLWTKGETSGNFLHVKEIFTDCDNDTLLIKVKANGPTCHTGNTSCFLTNQNEGFIRKLQDIIEKRKIESPTTSYTARMFNKGVNKIAQKVGEEATETVIEAVADNREQFIYEVADLVYHLSLLINIKGVSLQNIEDELAKRSK